MEEHLIMKIGEMMSVGIFEQQFIFQFNLFRTNANIKNPNMLILIEASRPGKKAIWVETYVESNQPLVTHEKLVTYHGVEIYSSFLNKLVVDVQSILTGFTGHIRYNLPRSRIC